MTKKGAQILITIQEMIYPAKNVELLSALFQVDALRRNARSKYEDESAQAIINSMATHSVGYKTTISGPIAMAIYRYANATYRKQLEKIKDVSPQLITMLRRRGQMGRFTFARRRRRIYGAEIEPYPRAIDDGNPETLTVVSITNESEQEHSCEAGCFYTDSSSKGNIDAKGTAATLETAQSNGSLAEAFFLALMPAMLEDTEFAQVYEDIYSQLEVRWKSYKARIDNDTEDDGKLLDLFAVATDNVKKRLLLNTLFSRGDAGKKDDSILIQALDLSRQNMEKNYTCGEYFGSSPLAFPIDETLGPDRRLENSEFSGRYALDPDRRFSAEEEKYLWQIPEWYILPEFVIEDCAIVKATSGDVDPVKNIMLTGPAGTGKSEAANAFAAGLRLPAVKQLCSAGTTEEDILGQWTPNVDGIDRSRTSAEVLARYDRLMEMGGMTRDNIATVLGLPDIWSVCYDPKAAYKAMTGSDMDKESGYAPGVHSALNEWSNRIIDEYGALIKATSTTSDGTPPLVYVESPLIRAVRNGWLVELQEITQVVHPGVLTCLNGLLDTYGKVVLSTGEIVRRHKDCVIVATTNFGYQGCRDINEAINDRFKIVEYVQMPNKEQILERVVKISGLDDATATLRLMLQTIEVMRAEAEKYSITAEIGMRSLIAWAQAYKVLRIGGNKGSAYKAGLKTVVNKAGHDNESRDVLRAALDTRFSEDT